MPQGGPIQSSYGGADIIDAGLAEFFNRFSIMCVSSEPHLFYSI